MTTQSSKDTLHATNKSFFLGTKKIHISGWIIAANLIFVVIVVVIASRYADWKSFLEDTRNMNFLWIVLVLVLQACTYMCVSFAWKNILDRFKNNTSLLGLLPLSFVKMFLDQAIPVLGLGGTAIAVRGFVQRGNSTHAAITTAAVYTFADLLVNSVLFIAALLILSTDQYMQKYFSLSRLLPIGFVVVSILLIVLLVLRNRKFLTMFKKLKPIAWLMEMQSHIPDTILFNYSMWIVVSIAIAAVWILDALTLWVILIALGVHAQLFSIFACSIISSALANMIIIPGGLGIFEGSSIALMGLFGIPLEQAIAASVLMRGFTFWLPMIPGFIIARREFI
jgi:uncharacterized protein (TIRG00374 family)